VGGFLNTTRFAHARPGFLLRDTCGPNPPPNWPSIESLSANNSGRRLLH